MTEPRASASWLNRTSIGVGLTSLFSDWSHEVATAILPAFLSSLGAGPGWLGLIEGLADGLSSGAKLSAGHYADRVRRRKPLVVAGYVVTTTATGALAFAGNAAQVLAARATAWVGRGARTPGRKALLAAAVPPEAYGRAFGFERMMDTLGAIAGPLTALWLLHLTPGDYSRVFLWTLVPGTVAIVVFAMMVRERPLARPAQISFQQGLRRLPHNFRWFLLAVGLFGLGDFAHTLLILYATKAMAPELGEAAAASLGIGLYLLHNLFYSGFAYLGGWLGDRGSRRAVLVAGYGVGAGMALLLALEPTRWLLLVAVFALGGISVGVEETLEDSLAAELAPSEQHGMAFGTLAAVNAIGDFGSSVLVGVLWSSFSGSVAFGVAGTLMLGGTVLMLRLRRA